MLLPKHQHRNGTSELTMQQMSIKSRNNAESPEEGTEEPEATQPLYPPLPTITSTSN